MAAHTAAPSKPVKVNVQAPKSPASWVSELQNPTTYVTAALVVTSVFQALHFPTHFTSVALAIVHIAAIVGGPVAVAAYAFMHAKKASAHESRLAQVESEIVAAGQSLFNLAGGSGEDALTYLENVVAAIRNVVTVQGPTGPTGPAGTPGAPGKTPSVQDVVNALVAQDKAKDVQING